jgi:peptide/nickel transport system substrate-binding protein
MRKLLASPHCLLSPAAAQRQETPAQWSFSSRAARPTRAARLLDASGNTAGKDGVSLHLTMKTSTDGDTRLLAAVLQQQLAKVGIALDLRSYEFATF